MEEPRIAVLIDADNAPATKIDAILSEVATVGVAHVRRAYGDWTNSTIGPWARQLQEYAIAPIQQFAYTKGKNASDIAMVIDAMDILHSGNADGFAIVSSDADFTPLVMRLRQSGATVLGFGQGKTPEAFVNACTRFVYLERIGGEADGASAGADTSERPERPTSSGGGGGGRTPGAKMRSNSRLVGMLRAAVDADADDHGWATLSAVGKQVRNQSSFEPRNYGYAKLIALLEEIDLFEIDRSTPNVLLRRKDLD